MSYARNRRLFASTSFQLALVCALVVAVAFALASVGVWFATSSAAERDSRERVQTEMEFMQSELRDGGIEAAIDAIRLRERFPGADYKLVGRDGQLIAGSLGIETPPLGWSTLYLPAPAAGVSSPDYVILSEPTPAGGRLTIAEDLEHTEGVRYTLLRTLFWFGATALFFSLAAGYFVTRGALRQMDELFKTMEKVGAGDLSARVPMREANNDVDLLGHRINDMLSRIGLLIDNLRRVSTDIAHDLRTPLTHVLHDLDAAATQPSRLAELTQSAKDRVQGLLRTFDAIMRLAEIEAGSARSRFIDVNLADLVDRVADAYRPDVENRGGRLEVSGQAPWIIQGDPELLSQALANLIENALRHAGPSPNIKVTATMAEQTLSVEDDGPGIPTEFRKAVLEPYVRLDNSRSTPGAGLGLAIAEAISRLHHATLVLEDAEPGLRVKLIWPA